MMINLNLLKSISTNLSWTTCCISYICREKSYAVRYVFWF